MKKLSLITFSICIVFIWCAWAVYFLKHYPSFDEFLKIVPSGVMYAITLIAFGSGIYFVNRAIRDEKFRDWEWLIGILLLGFSASLVCSLILMEHYVSNMSF